MGTSVFRFCAIPQVMAAGTLALCFNNDRVVKGVVKMRRGATSKLMIQQRSLADVCRTFHGFMGDIAAKVDVKAPNAERILEAVKKVEADCEGRLKAMGQDAIKRRDVGSSPLSWLILILLPFVVYCASAFGIGGAQASVGDKGTASMDLRKVFSVVYICFITILCFGGRGKIMSFGF